jgi:hypothetical protein
VIPAAPDPRKCAALDKEELEGTFWYPGPLPVSTQPGARPLSRWRLAKKVCESCPVKSRCRATSWGEEFGVWGGTDQYERYKFRRNLTRRLALMDRKERAKLAETLYGMRGATGWRIDAVTRETGYAAAMVTALVGEHVQRLKAEREAPAEAPRDAVDWARSRRWPSGPPAGDAWVERGGTVHSAQYVGQTANGRWLRMSMRLGKPSPVMRWVPADRVDLRTEIAPVVMKKGARGPRGAAAVNARKTHCIRGHEFTPENTYRSSDQKRACRTCNDERQRERRVRC